MQLPPLREEISLIPIGDWVRLRGVLVGAERFGWAELHAPEVRYLRSRTRPFSQSWLSAGSCWLRLQDGQLVEVEGAALYTQPEYTRLGSWDEVRLDPLAQSFPEDTLPTPTEVTLRGALLQAGEPVEVIGEVSRLIFAAGTGGIREAPLSRIGSVKAVCLARDLGSPKKMRRLYQNVFPQEKNKKSWLKALWKWLTTTSE